MSTMQLRKIEETKIDCAREFFARIGSDRVKYGVIDSYAKLINLVK
jgi:type III restriction enzyme